MMLVPIIGMAGQLSPAAKGVNVGCVDPTPYKWFPKGGVAHKTISAADVEAVAQLKMAKDANNPGLSTDLAAARAASADPVEKQK
jgi:hypothetical protein